MEVDCDRLLDRMFRNQSCHSGEILNLLSCLISHFFPVSSYFFAFTTFSIFRYLLEDNKVQL